MPCKGGFFMSIARKLCKLLGKKQEFCSAVLVAAGSSSRMRGEDKLLSDLGGMSVLERSVLALEQNERIMEIVVVTRADRMEELSQILHRQNLTKLSILVPGGETRQDSVEAGLRAVSKKATLVAIHDAARPMVSQKIITDTIAMAAKIRAAAPAIPVKDTIKVAKDRMIVETPDRSSLFAVQTPQVFDYDLIRGALKKAKQKGLPLTDDCSAAEHMGMKVALTEGAEENLKITTPIDLKIARMLLEEMK